MKTIFKDDKGDTIATFHSRVWSTFNNGDTVELGPKWTVTGTTHRPHLQDRIIHLKLKG